METFPPYWPFVWGIHRSPVNSPHESQWRGALMFSLICSGINGRVNNREAGDLRCYRAHYDVTVMQSCTIVSIYRDVWPITVRFDNFNHVSKFRHILWLDIISFYELISWASLHYAIRRFIIRVCDVSKPRDWVLIWSYRFGIGQACKLLRVFRRYNVL